MVVPIDPVSVAFYGTVIGSLLYGMFFVLAVSSTALHIKREARAHRKSSRPGVATFKSVLRNPMIMAGLLLSLTVTARWIFDLLDSTQGFLETSTAQDRFLVFINLKRPNFVGGIAVFIVSLLICDGMIIYRLWLVWNRSTLVVIFPVLTFIGMMVSGIGVTYQISITPLGETPFENNLGRWIVSDSVFNLLTNVYSTGLISWRIYKINSNVAGLTSKSSNLNGILVVLIESSAILSAWILFEMITYSLKTVLQSFVITTLGTVSGISFMLINVRVALGWTQTHPTTISTVVNTGRSATYPVPRSTEVRIGVTMDVDGGMTTTGELGDDGYELDTVNGKV